jgi:cytochrome c peroxidase
MLLGLCAGCDGETGEAPPWGQVPFPAPLQLDPLVADLGRLLFYDPVLSSDGETACATCHSELWGMSDGLAVSIGVGGGRLTGPGRKDGARMTRNAPTLWNVGLRQTLFWDGRESSLEQQVSAPLHSPIELDKAPDEVISELRSIPEYVALFEAAFGGVGDEALTDTNFRNAIASFQRTLVSSRSLYDAFSAGDGAALSAEMKDGMRRFSALGCTRCHTPPTFDSEAFFARGIGAGEDRGRAAVTGARDDEAAFRVPTLRNVRLSEPYFHDGSVATLDEAIAHEVWRETGRAASAEEVRALASFLGRALVDRSREPDRPEVVPSGLPVPIDGFRVLRP